MKISTKLLSIFLAALMVCSFIGNSSANELDARLNELKDVVKARYGENSPQVKTGSRNLFLSRRMTAYTRHIISAKAACSRKQTMMRGLLLYSAM